MSKHTPGPWSVEDVMGDGPIDICGPDVLGEGSPNLIATALYDAGSGHFEEHSRAAANARLIAAAPDLLSALKRNLPAIRAYSNLDDCEAAQAAIAKAEGED